MLNGYHINLRVLADDETKRESACSDCLHLDSPECPWQVARSHGSWRAVQFMDAAFRVDGCGEHATKETDQ